MGFLGAIRSAASSVVSKAKAILDGVGANAGVGGGGGGGGGGGWGGGATGIVKPFSAGLPLGTPMNVAGTTPATLKQSDQKLVCHSCAFRVSTFVAAIGQKAAAVPTFVQDTTKRAATKSISFIKLIITFAVPILVIYFGIVLLTQSPVELIRDTVNDASKNNDFCSISPDIIFGTDISSACEKHDRCYESGKSRRTCDSKLKQNIGRICNFNLRCHYGSLVYYAAVRLVGRDRYKGSGSRD